MQHRPRYALAAIIFAFVFVAGLTVVAVAPNGQAVAARQMALGLSSLPDRDISNVDAETALYGRAPAMWSIWNYWGGDFPTNFSNQLRDRGIVPFVWWLPVHGDGSAFSWNEILDGSNDAYIRSWARQAKDYGSTVDLRFAQEMDGNWFPWGNGKAGNNYTSFVAAWQHLWNIVRGEVGAQNVRFVWSPFTPRANWYPGDAYVDYAGFSAFNWGYPRAAWQSMNQVLSYNVSQAASITNKPIVVSELGSTPSGGDKAAWLANGYPNAYDSFPQIKAIVYFDIDTSPGQVDWRLITPQEARLAYRALLTDSRFQGSMDEGFGPPPPPPPTPTPTPIPTDSPPPPPNGTLVVGDDYTRSIASGWGRAGPGGAYQLTTSDFSVNGVQGVIRLRPGISPSALLNATAIQDVDLAISFMMPTLPEGSGSVWLYVATRRTAAGDEYRVKAQIDPGGRLRFGVSRFVGGRESPVAPVAVVGGLSAVPGSWVRMRAFGSGVGPTTWKVKAWDPSGPEPDAWPIVLTDATPELQVAGTLGVRAYANTTLTNLPLNMLVDDFNVSDRTGGGSPGPTPTPTTNPTPTPTPGQSTTLVSDDFSREVGNGLGSAPIGGNYGMNAPGFSVSGGTAVVSIPAGGSRDAQLKSAVGRDVELTATVTIRDLPTGNGSFWFYLVARRQSIGNEYRAKVRIDANGNVAIGISRVVGNSERPVIPETVIGGVTAKPGQRLRLKLRITGAGPTTVSARASDAGAGEPNDWISATDATDPLQQSGWVGFTSYLAPGVTNAPFVFEVDDFVVTTT